MVKGTYINDVTCSGGGEGGRTCKKYCLNGSREGFRLNSNLVVGFFIVMFRGTKEPIYEFQLELQSEQWYIQYS